MALMRNGVPAIVRKDCRVKVEYDFMAHLYNRFGLFLATPESDPKRTERDMFEWIRANCTGYVYFVRMDMRMRKSGRLANYIEFFFKRPDEASAFRIIFG